MNRAPTIDATELLKIRSETPGLEGQTFLLSCGASLMPNIVYETVSAHLKLEVQKGGYEAASIAREAVANVYASVARLLNASTTEIALVENATIAWQLAFYSFTFEPGDVVITAEAEYGANYVTLLQAREKFGIEIKICPSDQYGEIDLNALERLISDRVRMVALTWVPTNGGLVNPASEVGTIARKHGVPYLLDACQAVGQLPIDVEALKCDFLVGSARKFLRGPRGTGFLYVSQRMLNICEPPFIDHFGAPWVSIDKYDLRGDARRYESWESNVAAQLGMGAAADYAMEIGVDRIAARCTELGNRLRAGLSELTHVSVHDLGRSPSAIVSFFVDGFTCDEVVVHAKHYGINLSVSHMASTRIDAERRNLPQLVRAAPHYFNTEREIDFLISVVCTMGTSVSNGGYITKE